MTIRVLLADDHALVRAGFRMIIDDEDDLSVVAEARTGAEAISRAHTSQPDVVLMDIRMPTLDGIDATRRLTAQNRAPRVVILTTYDLDEYLFDALTAGASGFLLKDAPPENLLYAIRITATGDSLLSPRLTRRLIEQFARIQPSAVNAAMLDALTEREHDVLRLLARGKTNAEIAMQLLLGESTVKTHVSHILDKLALRDRVQAAITAYETGLIRPGQPDQTRPTT